MQTWVFVADNSSYSGVIPIVCFEYDTEHCMCQMWNGPPQIFCKFYKLFDRDHLRNFAMSCISDQRSFHINVQCICKGF